MARIQIQCTLVPKSGLPSFALCPKCVAQHGVARGGLVPLDGAAREVGRPLHLAPEQQQPRVGTEQRGVIGASARAPSRNESEASRNACAPVSFPASR